MITVTLKEIVNGAGAMRDLMEEVLPSKAAYQVAKLGKNMRDEYQYFEETRLKLIQKYGRKDANGQLIIDEANQYSIAPENIEAFNNELNELMNTNVELMNNKLDLESLKCELTANQMVDLMPFLDTDDEEDDFE